jgi:very-short-patch-repair endonuclease
MRSRAKELRRAMTISERRLWNWLRNRTFERFKFRRQVPVGPYVLDFFCPALKLAIEVDGVHHETPWVAEYDDSRASYLDRHGIRVVRITNELLAKDSWLVEEVIRDAVARRS